MICCLNPYCSEPLNPDDQKTCLACDGPLVVLLKQRFKVIEPIGRGGFGKTYIAEDVDKLNERCILKQLIYRSQNEAETQKVLQLFAQEARQLQQLGEHPQIPALSAYFQAGDFFFLAQQLIEGQDLMKEFEQEGVFSETKIRALLESLLPVLAFVHAQRVIHRDIKPENIMRQAGTGKLMLIDFGVAKVLPTAATTQTGTMIGSQGYVSPEQARGKVKPASDLFSLGATCFHLLTGVNPSDLWVERGYSWMAQWQQYMPEAVSPDLAYVLDRLLVKDMQHRYQTAEAVLGDLQQPPARSTTAPPPRLQTDPTLILNTQGPRTARSSASQPLTRSSPTGTRRDRPSPSTRTAAPAPAPAPQAALLIGIGLAATLLVGMSGFILMQLRRGTPTPAQSIAPTPAVPLSPVASPPAGLPSTIPAATPQTPPPPPPPLLPPPPPPPRPAR